MNKFPRRLSHLFGLAAAGLALVAPNIAFAANACVGWTGVSITGCFFTLFQWITFIISYFITWVTVSVFSIESFLLTILLDLNLQVANSLVVQTGFSIVLAFANILFVAAIIGMAVATIVRYDAFGAKQLLFKIIIAAIGVNLSLVLAGTFISATDQISRFLLNAASGDDPAASSITNSHNFVDRLAGAFNPQQLLISSSSTAPSLDNFAVDVEKDFANFGGMFAAVLGIYLTAGMGVILALFMGILVLAFAARYIMLHLLLIIMPAVWIAWIFPFWRKYVNDWRDKFFKWTMFAPMSLFFLYLAMKGIEVFDQMHLFADIILPKAAGSDQQYTSIAQGVSTTLGNFAQPVIQNLIKFTLTAGLLFGGLYFASKMGITGAAMGTSAMQSLGNSVKRRVQQGVKDRAVGAWDRARTSGKDDKGNSRVQRWSGAIAGSKLATGGGGWRVGRGAIRALTGVKVENAVGTIAKVGVADKDASKKRAEVYADQNSALTSSAMKTKLDRVFIDGTLKVRNPDERQGLIQAAIKAKAVGDLHKHAFEVDEDGVERVNEAGVAKLKEIMDSAERDGYAEDIVKANPLMAEFMKPKKTKLRDAAGNILKDKDGKDQERLMTSAEMLHANLKKTKAEDINDIASKNPDLWGSVDPSATPNTRQIMAVKALGGKVNKIDDPEIQLRIQNTAAWIFERRADEERAKKKYDAEKLQKHNEDSSKFDEFKAKPGNEKLSSDEVRKAYEKTYVSDYYEKESKSVLYRTPPEVKAGDNKLSGPDDGLGFNNSDFEAFKPLIKALDKNTTIAPILQAVVKSEKKSQKKNDDSDVDDTENKDTSEDTDKSTKDKQDNSPVPKPESDLIKENRLRRESWRDNATRRSRGRRS